MRITVNERPREIAPGSLVSDAARLYKGDADILIRNGFPCQPDTVLEDGDRLVMIRRGEVPSPDELSHLLTARHTPGVHDRLKKTTVGIAGCGGLGSTAALALARSGVGRLIIADFDVVEPSNLNRQQYFLEHIGRPKVEALKELIGRASPLVEVEARQVRITAGNAAEIFGPAQVLVEAFDLADQKLMLIEAVEKLMPQMPLVIGNGMAGYGANGLMRMRRAGNIYVCGDETSEAGPGLGLMAPRVGLAACMQANQVLEILLGRDPRIEEAVKRSLPPAAKVAGKGAREEKC
jgi:sulfur carrier protein ThiS adenylyltransferase